MKGREWIISRDWVRIGHNFCFTRGRGSFVTRERFFQSVFALETCLSLRRGSLKRGFVSYLGRRLRVQKKGLRSELYWLEQKMKYWILWFFISVSWRGTLWAWVAIATSYDYDAPIYSYGTLVFFPLTLANELIQFQHFPNCIGVMTYRTPESAQVGALESSK